MGTGKEVYLPPGHSLATGMTQQSGKTTLIEALVDRGDITAIAFITKRGEIGFTNQHLIQPYYQEQKLPNGVIDWQWAESILSATLGEKMKFERYWIQKICKNAHSLEEVYRNAIAFQEASRRPLDIAQYTLLESYFEIIVPETKKHNFADALTLRKGFNVMNLVDMPDQMQQLVIRATMEYIYRKLTNTVVIIPEAHKFIPDSNTPVKSIALKLIREGAAPKVQNFVWIDTQETASIDKALLKQVSNWVMGYQQEKNEVKNVREHLGNKIKADDINSLKLGHFIASLRRRIFHVYALPRGIPIEMGRRVALGEITPEQVKEEISRLKEGGEEEMYRQKLEELENQFAAMKRSKDETIRALSDNIERLKQECEALIKGKGHAVDTTGLRLDLEKANNKLKDYEKTLEQVNKEVENLQNNMSKQTEEHSRIVSSLSGEIQDLKDKVRSSDAFMTAFRDIIVETMAPILHEDRDAKSIQSISADRPESVDLSVEQPQLNVTVVKKIARIEVNVSTSRGKLYWLYVNGRMDSQKINTSTVISMLEAEGWSRFPQIKEYLEEMEKYGYLAYAGKEARMTNYRVKMPSEEAKQRGLITFKEEVV